VIDGQTVVVGLGNPILSDDGVGIQVAALVRQQLQSEMDIEVITVYAGGLRLMEAIAGYRRAIIIDAMKSGQQPAGSIRVFPLAAASGTRHTFCAHDGDLGTILTLARDLGLAIPQEITIIGIEALEMEIFSEELSPAVRAALPAAVAAVVSALRLSN
jgi:hydrogenase maturation protease